MSISRRYRREQQEQRDAFEKRKRDYAIECEEFVKLVAHLEEHPVFGDSVRSSPLDTLLQIIDNAGDIFKKY